MTPFASPPDSLFPAAQALPYCVFLRPDAVGARAGVAVGDQVMDLALLEAAGLFRDALPSAEPIFNRPSLNAFMALGRPAWEGVRAVLRRLVAGERPLPDGALVPLADARLLMPVEIGDYTDFYSSREHATNAGAMFRAREEALLPNWLHLPVAYHGRASSVVLGGTPIVRPMGQYLPAGAEQPVYGPTRELDFELELGFFVGPGNDLGRPIDIADAADHIFGFVLVNDWSARDTQRWEYRPLGPFLGKNFATSISPWVVPLAALEPFRVPGPVQEPQPLPYLLSEGDWAFDIRLEARLQTRAMAEAGIPTAVITATNARHLYWNAAQQLAHHTVNGCNLRPGDLLASGTISGPSPDSFGSLLELAWNGTRPLALPTGETRAFLEDGDNLTIAGWCQGEGYRVDLGEVGGLIVSSH